MYTDRIGRAIELASACHENQYRKNPGGKIPFVAHVVSVGMMLAHHGYAEEVVIAGILHDSVEDTEMTLEGVEEEFGERVAGLVWDVSEQDKSLSWSEGKAHYVDQLSQASDEAKAISCCGVTHNMKSILGSLEDGHDIWTKLKQGREEQLQQFGRLLVVYRNSGVKSAVLKGYLEVLEALNDS